MVLFACADGACAQILGGELEVERHLRPSADVALGFDTTAVGLNYGLGDGEAQPCAFLLARPGFVYAVEALEDVGRCSSGMPGPRSSTRISNSPDSVVAKRVTSFRQSCTWRRCPPG